MNGLKIEDLYKINHSTKEFRSSILAEKIKSGNQILLKSGETVTFNTVNNSKVITFLENMYQSNKDEVNEFFKNRGRYADIFTVENDRKIRLNDIGKNNEFVGKNPNYRGEDKTKEQEMTSALFLDKYINTKRYPSNAQILKTNKTPLSKAWEFTYRRQSKLLKKWIGKVDFKYNVYRGEGFVKQLNEIIMNLDELKNSSWNPADIWLVKRGLEAQILEEVKRGIETHLWNLTMVNKHLKRYFEKKYLLPVSLKKMRDESDTLEVYNKDKSLFYDFNVERWSWELKWNKDRTWFSNQDSKIYLNGMVHNERKKFVFQFRLSELQSGNTQIEVKKRPSSSRVGKVPIKDCIEVYYQKKRKENINVYRIFRYEIEPINSWDEKFFKYWRSIFQKLLINSNIESNLKDDKEFENMLREIFTRYIQSNAVERKNFNDVMIVKLQGLKYLYDFCLFKENHCLEEALIEFYKGALKINSKSCVYIKLG